MLLLVKKASVGLSSVGPIIVVVMVVVMVILVGQASVVVVIVIVVVMVIVVVTERSKNLSAGGNCISINIRRPHLVVVHCSRVKAAQSHGVRSGVVEVGCFFRICSVNHFPHCRPIRKPGYRSFISFHHYVYVADRQCSN